MSSKYERIASAIGGTALAFAIVGAITFVPMIIDAVQPDEPPAWMVEAESE